jgi:putative oxidoreductase
MSALGLLSLRLVVAAVLLAHGAHTLFGFWGGPGVGPGGLSNETIRLANLGLQPGYLIALLTGLVQITGGALLAVGWLTRWASAAVLLRVLIDLWVVHRSAGFFMNWTNDPVRGHGIEYGLVLAGALVCLALAGPGEMSLDGSRRRWSGRQASARERLRRRL